MLFIITVRLKGEKIKELRKTLGYTQAALAQKAAVSISTVKNIESKKGGFEPSIYTVAKIAVALECKIDELVERGEELD